MSTTRTTAKKIRTFAFTLFLTQQMPPPAIIHHIHYLNPQSKWMNERNGEQMNQPDQSIYKPIEESAIAGQTKAKTNQHDWLNGSSIAAARQWWWQQQPKQELLFFLYFWCSMHLYHHWLLLCWKLWTNWLMKQTNKTKKCGCSHSMHAHAGAICYFVKKQISFLFQHTHTHTLHSWDSACSYYPVVKSNSACHFYMDASVGSLFLLQISQVGNTSASTPHIHEWSRPGSCVSCTLPSQLL